MSRFLLGVAIGVGLGYALHLLFQPVAFQSTRRQRRRSSVVNKEK